VYLFSLPLPDLVVGSPESPECYSYPLWLFGQQGTLSLWIAFLLSRIRRIRGVREINGVLVLFDSFPFIVTSLMLFQLTIGANSSSLIIRIQSAKLPCIHCLACCRSHVADSDDAYLHDITLLWMHAAVDGTMLICMTLICIPPPCCLVCNGASRILGAQQQQAKYGVVPADGW
jgi:hypothetical protein